MRKCVDENSGACGVGMNIFYLVVCKTDVPGEEDRQPIAAELDFDALGQFLQRREVVGGEVVGQRYVELLFMRLNVDLWSVEKRQGFVLRGAVGHTWNNVELHPRSSLHARGADGTPRHSRRRQGRNTQSDDAQHVHIRFGRHTLICLPWNMTEH